jgi:4-hydroxyphenylpyruvate dioxygenase-like putative hemolysin
VEESDAILVAMMERQKVIIELYQVCRKDLKELRSRKDGHIDHVAFDVTDIDQAFNELKDAGFEPIQEAPVFLDFWEKGCKYFAIRGPDSEKLEFNQIL